MSILFRIADRSDIQQMQVVRHLVEENKLVTIPMEQFSFN